MTGARKLSIAITPLAQHAALLDGRVTIPDVELVEVPTGKDHAEIFRRMGRNLDFDICELSVMTYYCARQYGLPIAAVPVVPRHGFHHGDFLKNVNAGISEPKDLEGKRVGTRTYTVTPGVLDKGILADEFGVDVDRVTWVLAEPEHVAACEEHYPPNVVAGKGEDLFPRLASGDLDAGIAGSNLNRKSSDEVVPLFPDAEELDRKQYERTGIIPVFTCIAFKSDLLQELPSLGEMLFDAFVQARSFGIEPNAGVARIVDGDPVPVGLSANRASFEELIDLGQRQHILSGPMAVDDLFPPYEPS